MSKSSTPPTKKSAFIDARLSQSRLLSEHATCATLTNKEPLQAQLRADTASGFTIGLDLPEEPKVIVISIEFKAILKTLVGDNDLIEYEAKHEVQFIIEGWTGFDDWTNLPSESIAPYLAVVHNIARKKAEATIIEMGFIGLSLPQPEHFDGKLLPANPA